MILLFDRSKPYLQSLEVFQFSLYLSALLSFMFILANRNKKETLDWRIGSCHAFNDLSDYAFNNLSD